MDMLNILVVDDDRDFAEALTDVLEAENHRVDRCHTGEDAVELFERNQYDISFMDVKLPCKNGVESFLEIRSRNPAARVVMMTGYSMEQLLQTAVENGAWAVMHKPLDMTQVLEIVEGVSAPALVVIVDDEVPFIVSLTKALEAEGLRARVAGACEEGAEMIREGAADLVILDLRPAAVGGVVAAICEGGLGGPAIIVTGDVPDGGATHSCVCAVARVEVLLKPCAPGEVARLAAAMVKER